MTPPVHVERVLSTLNQDGTRNWLRPRLARGRFLRRRRIIGYSLVALFVALPFVTIDGRPALLLDVMTRELAVFGSVFRPDDGFLLMLVGLVIVLAVFLLTALFGRVWCGWACPQTVYLELVFRPIERWLEGTSKHQATLGAFHPRRLVKWMTYAALSFALANVFLAYFVGAARLRVWVIESPVDHVGGFSVVLAVSALILFDFGYFREQTCSLACPYGRLQAVLLDRQSWIVGYDARRGEPRGQPRKRLPVVAARGDCVDCGACVAVCPAGIDIRDGLQMECIGCAQCVDACDTVMDKLGKPRGLIGHTSQDRLAGTLTRLLRARTVLYPVLLAIAGGALVWSLVTRSEAEITVERITGASFVALPDGTISSQARLKIENAGDTRRRYTISLVDRGDLHLRSQAEWDVDPSRSVTVPVFVDVPRAGFHGGRRSLTVRVADGAGFHRVVALTLFGPSEAP